MKLDWRVGVALAATLIACTDPTKHPAGCHGDVALAVGLAGSGPDVPVFGWSPGCGISRLSVETVPAAGGAGILVWQFTAPENAQVGPAILYGKTPRGAMETRTALQLSTGVTYRVTVVSTVGGDGVSGSGTITFQL
jgi:hypothetical protein